MREIDEAIYNCVSVFLILFHDLLTLFFRENMK